MPDITNLATKAALNTKVPEVEDKIPDIPIAIQADLNTKATEIEKKVPDTTRFITTPESIRLTKTNFDATMKQESRSLASKMSCTALDIADKIEKKIRNLQKV